MRQLKVSLLASLKKNLTLVDQKRHPSHGARLHFYNIRTLTILGSDKAGETSDSSLSSQRRSFRRLKHERQRKRSKGGEKKKKLKWLTAHTLPSQRLPTEL